jgi:uncharacterized membrane protein (UPF0136 family)
MHPQWSGGMVDGDSPKAVGGMLRADPENLHSDYLDLYFCHRPDGQTPRVFRLWGFDAGFIRIISLTMKNNNLILGRWYIGFGIFLGICGVLGYASNPAEAKTALLSGGTFGALSSLWGFWMLKNGGKLPRIAAAVTTLMLCAAFTWRATVSWQAVSRGEPKGIAALLISAMLVGSVLSMVMLLVEWKRQN